MRAIFAALALAGALAPFTAARAPEPAAHVAQMSRDVTGAVRKQRDQQRARLRAPRGHVTQEGKP